MHNSLMVGLDHIPPLVKRFFDVHDYRHAAAILACDYQDEFDELCSALVGFTFTDDQIRKGGGNESDIPKTFSSLLRPLGWQEQRLKARVLIDDETVRSETHKIDYIKNKVACELEWNAKDQTFDRDLSAFRTFFEYGRVSVGVLVTRSLKLVPYFRQLGAKILSKYGAEGGSTTHMGKLLPRIDSGRSGGCPVLAIGITPQSRRESKNAKA